MNHSNNAILCFSVAEYQSLMDYAFAINPVFKSNPHFDPKWVKTGSKFGLDLNHLMFDLLKDQTKPFSTKISAFWLGPHNLNRKLQLILIQLHNSSFCYVITFYILDDKLVVGQPLVINPVIFFIKPVNIETVTSSKTCRAGVEDNAMSVSQRVT